MFPQLADNDTAFDYAAWLSTVRSFSDTWPAGVLGGEAQCPARPVLVPIHNEDV